MGRGNVKISITADTSGLERGSKRAESSLGRLGSAAQTSGHHFGTLAKAMAGAAAAYVGISQAKKAIESTDGLAKATIGLHRSLGLTIKQASAWAAVASSRGVEAKQLNQAFGTLAKNIQAAAQGGKTQIKVFKELGISQDDLKKQSFEKTLGQVADGLKNLPPGFAKTADSMKLFGRGWQTIVPVIRSGSDEMNRQLQLADKYGATFNKTSIGGVEKLVQKSRELKLAQEGLRKEFTVAVAPALLKVEGAALRVVRIFEDPKLTGDQKWKKVGQIISRVADQAEKAFERIFPKIVDIAAAQAPRAASAFVNAWLRAGIWGKLFTVALIGSKLGVFSTVASLAVKAFAKRYIPAMATAGAAGGAAAAGTEGLTSGATLGKFRLAGKVAGGLLGAALIAEVVNQIRQGGGSITDQVQGLILPLSPRGNPGGPKGYKPPKGAPPYHKDNGPLRLNGPGGTGNSGGNTHHPHGRPRAAAASVGASSASSGWRPCQLTWYDPALGGINSGDGSKDPHHPTASGEPYEPNAMTCAAPPQYAFGTLIQFAYGGRSITCRVNDRGGAIQGAHFDLTRGAAATLGTLNAGLATAQFRVVGKGGTVSPPSSGGGGSSRSSAPPPVSPRFPGGLRRRIGGAQHTLTVLGTAVGTIDRLVSQAERRGDYGTAIDLLGDKLSDEKRMLRAAKRALKGYRAELKILQHQMRTAPKGQRSKIAQAIKDVRQKIRDLVQQVRDLGLDIGDTKLDIKDEINAAGEVTDTSDSGVQTLANGATINWAAIPPGSPIEQYLNAHGYTRPDTGTGAGGSSDDTAAALEALAAAAQELKDAVDEQNRIIAGTSAVTDAEIRKAFVNLINGELGGSLYERTLTPGSGVRVRY